MSFYLSPGCVCCGSTTRELHKLPSHIGTLRACSVCILKFGAANLALEADRLLASCDTKPQGPTCMVCGDPVVYVDSRGSFPVWCQKCEDQRRRLVANA